VILAPIAWFIVTPWRFIGLVITMVLVQWSLFRSDAVFTVLSGLPTIDVQNVVSVDEVVRQIQSYSADAILAYELFAVIDYGFPLLAGLVQAAAALWLIRVANARTRRQLPQWLVLIFLLAPAVDYLENIAIAVAIATDGATLPVTLALVFKAGKLSMLAISSAALFVTLGYTLAVVARHWMKRAQ
jgi:hypothetical protein